MVQVCPVTDIVCTRGCENICRNECNSKVAPIRWTDRQPSQVGYYWFRPSEKDADIVSLMAVGSLTYADGEVIYQAQQCGYEGHTKLHNFSGQWFGPINPPSSEDSRE